MRRTCAPERTGVFGSRDRMHAVAILSISFLRCLNKGEREIEKLYSYHPPP
jgi:hypothetical protein